ncbi:neugrin domain-containing protein [Phthorimaea operculella]|nr:neugrin domain-containing protein [Phthorimaea operculella]
MFAVAFRRLCYVGDKVIVRNLRTRNVRVPEANPGLQKRIDAFREEGMRIEDEDAEEFVEASESDFYNVGEAYNAHLNENLAGKLEKRHHIIKEKYFKENMPNLLTWSEKEQIRHLAQTQPDEWTPERIAESFPVTVPVVKKLLKYAWKPSTKERIARHDASAMRNWKELKEGSLGISEDLRKHFLKFSERTIPPLNQQSIKIDLTQERKIGEFESIIRKCAAKDEQKEQNQSQDTSSETDLATTQRKSVKKDYKRVTLDELAERIQNRLDKGKDISMNDTIMLNTVNTRSDNQTEVSKVFDHEIGLVDDESRPTEIALHKEKESELQIDFTQRIRIPKSAYKKGATYKVNDCYYDDDGKFLYRVLGVTK